MIMFAIKKPNNELKDFSGNVVAENYDVSRNDIFITWNDGFGKEHRRVKRTQVSGTFTMLFEKESQYNVFLSVLQENMNEDGTHKINVAINKPRNTSVWIDAYIDFKPKRSRNAMWQDKFDAFTVTIKEK